MTSIIFGIFFINLQILLFLRYYEFEKRLEDINYFINKYRKKITIYLPGRVEDFDIEVEI